MPPSRKHVILSGKAGMGKTLIAGEGKLKAALLIQRRYSNWNIKVVYIHFFPRACTSVHFLQLLSASRLPTPRSASIFLLVSLYFVLF